MSVRFEALEERLLLALPTSWTSVGIGGGGSFFSPSFSPYNPTEIYVATDMSDQYHTTDLGATWQVLDFRQIQGKSYSAVQFTNDPNVLYSLGTSGSPIKSADGGKTWATLPGSVSSGMTLLADITDKNRFFVSSYSQIFFTANGGTSYTTIAAPSAYVAGAFFDGGNIYLATDKGVLVSNNNGSTFSMATWGNIPATEGIVSFAGAKTGATTRFFVVTATGSEIYPGIQGGICYSYKGVYTIDVGQTSWTRTVSGIAAGDRPAYVSMPKNDISTVYLGGGSSNSSPTVYKTTNGGASWTSMFHAASNQNVQTGWQGYNGDLSGWGFGELAMGFAVAPYDASKIMITDMGGAHLSTDGGATWKAVYDNPADLNAAGQATPKKKAYHGNGMEPTTVWGLAWADPNNLFASFTDIQGLRSTDGGSSWSFNYTGQTYNTMYRSVVQPGTGNLYAAVSSVHDIYESEAYQSDGKVDGGTGEVLFSTNLGGTWSRLHNFSKPVVWVSLDPSNPNRMYASVVNHAGAGTAGGIYVSNDINLGAASTWTKLTDPPRTEGHPFDLEVLNDGTLVATYAGRWTSDGVRSASSGVFMLPAGSTTWTDTTASTAAMQYFCHDITIDPSDTTQSTWYVGVWFTTSNVYWPEGGLYKTTDRGQHWSLVNGSAAMGKVSQVAFNPLNSEEMYITTGNKGLWFTSNAHAASPTLTPVTTYPFAEPIRVVFNPYNAREVWITSFGNGLRMGLDTSGLLPGDSNMDGKVRFADYLVLEQNFGKAGNWTRGDFNNDGKVSFSDYLLLEQNFGKPTGSTASSPPSGLAPSGLSDAPVDGLVAADLLLSDATGGVQAVSIRPAGATDLAQFFMMPSGPLSLRQRLSAKASSLPALRGELHSAAIQQQYRRLLQKEKAAGADLLGLDAVSNLPRGL